MFFASALLNICNFGIKLHYSKISVVLKAYVNQTSMNISRVVFREQALVFLSQIVLISFFFLIETLYVSPSSFAFAVDLVLLVDKYYVLPLIS